MSAPLKIGIIGLGRMGQVYARTLATSIAGGRLYAIAESDERLRVAMADAFNVSHAFVDAHDLIAHPDVAAVVIATPTSTHPELVIAAARAGKAIFCEKPLALTLEATHAVLEVVAKAAVPLQVGFMRRFDAAYQKAYAYIAAGKIGRPITFKSIGRDPFCPRKEYANPALSGGLIIDMAIHDFDLARWLMGSEVVRVSAEGTLLVCEQLQEVGDIDNAVVNMRFANEALGNVEVSRNAFYGYDIRTEVLGSKGAIIIGKHQHTPVLLLNRDGVQHDVTPYLMERFGDAYSAQVQHFVDCLQKNTPPSVGGADSLAALEIGLAATQAYQTKRIVTIDELRTHPV
jgi:inositol 2-dehydrogenase